LDAGDGNQVRVFLLLELSCLSFSIYQSPVTLYYEPAVIRYSDRGRGLTFAVRVVPRASITQIAGEHDGALRVRIAAPPVDGAANKELVKVLASSFELPQNAVEIISGANSKTKTVRIRGADAAQLEQLIGSS